MEARHSSARESRTAVQGGNDLARHHYAALIFIICLGLLLSILLFLSVRNKELLQNKAEFSSDAAEEINAIRSALKHSLNEIDALSSFYCVFR